jgi:hypothetical protein
MNGVDSNAISVSSVKKRPPKVVSLPELEILPPGICPNPTWLADKMKNCPCGGCTGLRLVAETGGNGDAK